jgi:hypothetical protein
VTDPPYGVRAGAKRIGRKDPSKVRRQPFIFPEGHPDAGKASHVLPDCTFIVLFDRPSSVRRVLTNTVAQLSDIPPFKPYEIADLAVDLVRLARYALRPGGRLVFFLPVVSEKYENVDVPLVDGMTIVGNSVEDFGKWARRGSWSLGGTPSTLAAETDHSLPCLRAQQGSSRSNSRPMRSRSPRRSSSRSRLALLRRRNQQQQQQSGQMEIRQAASRPGWPTCLCVSRATRTFAANTFQASRAAIHERALS